MAFPRLPIFSPILLQAIAILLASSAFNLLYARCVFKPTVYGFIHHNQHLPANAKGVLFQPPAPPNIYRVRKESLEKLYLLTAVSPMLSAHNFTIEELGSGKKLKPIVVPLFLQTQLDKNLDSQSKFFAFASAKHRLAKCAAQNLHSLDGCEEIESTLEKLITDGVLYNATEEVKKAHGLIRVSAEPAFIPGKEYVVRYLGPGKDSRSVKYARSSHITIDEKPVPSLNEDSLVIEMSDVIEGAIPSSASKKVRYRLPAAMQPYLDSVWFFTMIKWQRADRSPIQILSKEQSVLLSQVKEQISNAKMAHYCGDSTALGNKGGMGEYLQADIPECHEAKGLVGLLEVDELLAVSNVLHVNCP